VAVDIEGGIIKGARIALGGVGTKPWRSLEAENAIIGLDANRDTYNKAAEAAMMGAIPNKDNAYKLEMAKRTLVRALETAGGMS
jgi:xanthine dehydrogenase YagS FAD-binding subunit